MSLRDALQGIYDQRKVLTPEIVLAEATPEDHPLHNSFEWDDTIAGPKYRLVQAREMIQSVKISYRAADGQLKDLRAFYAVRGPGPSAYQPTEEILQNDLSRKILLADLERDWKALKKRYEHLEEFAAVIMGDLGTAQAG